MKGDFLLAALSSNSLPERIPLKSVYYAFNKLSKSRKYSYWLSSLNFIMGPDIPISEELEIALFRFCSAGLGTVDNPDYRYLRMSRKTRSAIREIVKQHLKSEPDKLKELRDLSTDFAQKVSFWITHEEKSLSI